MSVVCSPFERQQKSRFTAVVTGFIIVIYEKTKILTKASTYSL